MQLTTFDPIAISDELAEMEFHNLTSFNEGGAGVFWSEPGGPSPWEMHPDCDEMLQVLDGEIEVEVLPSGGGTETKVKVRSGTFVVVPRGCWHRQRILAKTKEFYLTPGQTLRSSSEDPRKDHPVA